MSQTHLPDGAAIAREAFAAGLLPPAPRVAEARALVANLERRHDAAQLAVLAAQVEEARLAEALAAARAVVAALTE